MITITTTGTEEIFWVDGPKNEMVSDRYFASPEEAIEWANQNLAHCWHEAGYGVRFAPVNEI